MDGWIDGWMDGYRPYVPLCVGLKPDRFGGQLLWIIPKWLVGWYRLYHDIGMYSMPHSLDSHTTEEHQMGMSENGLYTKIAMLMRRMMISID